MEKILKKRYEDKIKMAHRKMICDGGRWIELAKGAYQLLTFIFCYNILNSIFELE
jgi:hypothetical protein